MVPSETINIWTFKAGPTPFHCLPLTICLCFLVLELQITVLEVYLFSFFASQNNYIGLFFLSFHLLVVLVNSFPHLLESCSHSFSLRNDTLDPTGNFWLLTHEEREGGSFFVRCGFQTCENFPDAVECSSLKTEKQSFMVIALIWSTLYCSFLIPVFSDDSLSSAIPLSLSWAMAVIPLPVVCEGHSLPSIYTTFSAFIAIANNPPTESRKGLNFETSWGGNTFYDEITALEINTVIAVTGGL